MMIIGRLEVNAEKKELSLQNNFDLDERTFFNFVFNVRFT